MDRPIGSGRIAAASRELTRLMGRVVANAEMYGLQHRAATDAMDRCYEFVAPILDFCECIDFSMANGMLMVEGEPAGTDDPFLNALARRLTDIELSGLSLWKGLTREEFGKLIEIMFTGVPVADEEGDGMRQALAECGIEHARVQTVTFRAITEHEEVVLKSAERGSGRRGDGGEAEGDGNVVEQITAFLKGDVAAESGDAAKASENIAALLLSDPERLARFIMETAVIQSREAMPSGELSDMIVACLGRVRHALLKERPVTGTHRKLALKKNLLLLGKELLINLQRASVPADPVEEAAISAAVEEIAGKVEIKALASVYAKKRASLAKAEKELLRTIKNTGAENIIESGLDGNLSGEGVTAGDWRMLLAKASGGSASGGAPGAVSEILALLVKLEEMIRAGRPDADAITGVTSQVNEQVMTLADQTGQKIDVLEQQIQQLDEAIADTEKPERVKAAQSRKDLLKLLADIVEQLCQPVTVMSTAIQMVIGEYLGPVNDEQKETLSMGVESGESAQKLLQRLIGIVGSKSL